MMKPHRHASLTDWLMYLETTHPDAIELGLTRVSKVVETLSLHQPAPYVITVAGTNGKGTTCRALEMILIEAGYRVGVYSSPHLLHYTERVRIQNQQLSEQTHVWALSTIDQAREAIPLTYFEFSTLSAFLLFQKYQVEIAIVEVGLGGRLDATNCIDPDIAVITSIGLDHTDWLGTTRERIGREKAGIARAAKPLVVGEPEMPSSVRLVAEDMGAVLYACQSNIDSDWSYQEEENGMWTFSSSKMTYRHLPLPQIPLANAATAVATLAYSTLSISERALHQGLKAAKLPGRFQIIQENPTIILDVAHNPHAAAYLAQKISTYRSTTPHKKVIGVVGMLKDKDIEGTLSLLQPSIDSWYYAPLQGSRGASIEDIQQYLPFGTAAKTIMSALDKAKQEATPNDIIIVFGSFLTVSEVLATL